jgi:hypothetical protein
MKAQEPEKKDPIEKTLAEEAIREVLESEDRAHIICTDPQKDGTFTPIITIDDHAFKSEVYYASGDICLEMYERLLLNSEKLVEFRGKVRKVDKIMEPAGVQKRTMRMVITTPPEHLAVVSLISVKGEDGKEKMVEVFRQKLSFLITWISMFYFGALDTTDEAATAAPAPPQAT